MFMEKSKKAKPAPKAAAPLAKPPARQTKAPKNKTAVKNEEELFVENLATLTGVVEALGETLELLVQKAENMAYHIIATEQVVAELVTSNGLDLARVNARIRAKIAAGTDLQVDSSRAIDVAAAIASPLPR